MSPKYTEQYDWRTAELEELHKKQKAIQSEELLKSIEYSCAAEPPVRCGVALPQLYVLRFQWGYFCGKYWYQLKAVNDNE